MNITVIKCIKFLFHFINDSLITFLKNLDGVSGYKLRYFFYKKRFKYLGANVRIDTGVEFVGMEFISIGNDTHIDKNCIIVACSENLNLSHRYLKLRHNRNYVGKRGEVFIGMNCHISQSAMIFGYGGVCIGNNSVISTGGKLYSLTSMPYNPFNRSEIVSIVPYEGVSPTLEGPIVLGENVWIGIDAVVSPGVVIGNNSFVKSFSFVMDSFNENSYIGGIPAKFERNRFEI